MALPIYKGFHISPLNKDGYEKLLKTTYKRVHLDKIEVREVYFQYPCLAGTVDPFTEIKDITITIKNQGNGIKININ
ncbi:hypothetical protein EZS27_043910 [termite gut metagenome]|uniref:Uncharacterized protein n=1 Tax=termite gut metagenome TaxID=433724 RepID=A0A5J4P574_9ZZZZ